MKIFTPSFMHQSHEKQERKKKNLMFIIFLNCSIKMHV